MLAVALGFFAPRVEHALSGAGWQANGSESVQVRDLVQREFAGLNSTGLMVVVHSAGQTTTSPQFAQTVRRVAGSLKADDRVASVQMPVTGQTISRDGHTAIVMAGANADANEMVRAADDLKGPLTALGSDQVQVAVTGASGMWSDFNEANRSAMMRSEMFSWPVTLGILVLAFGSLVAAGLPLLLTMLGLLASAGSLALLTELTPISIWAMNFALMFALALGIDYALFVVYRFRGALLGSRESSVDAVTETMDTAGKAVLFSGVTVLISLTAVMLVDSPAFRSMALGIMLSVIFVLAATLTLLPAVLGKLGPRVDKLALPLGAQQRAPLSPGSPPGASGCGATRGCPASPPSPSSARWPIPVLSLHTGMPSIKVVPAVRHQPPGLRARPAGVRNRRAGRAAGRGARRPGPAGPRAAGRRPGDRAGHRAPAWRVRRCGAAAGDPEGRPILQASWARAIDRLRAELPPTALIGGAPAENHDLEAELAGKTPLVIGVVLGLGFLLLLVALQAPLVAAIGVATSLLATGAAFGVAKLDLPGRPWVQPARASSRRASWTPGAPCSSSR